MNEYQKLILHLQNITLFSGLSKKDMDQILKISTFHSAPQNFNIIKEGAAENLDIYALIEGEVRVIIHTGEKDIVLTVIKENDKNNIFGEMSLITAHARTASVISNKPVKLIRISHKKLLELIKNNASIGMQIYKNLVEVVAYRLECTNILLQHTIDWGW